MSWSAHCVHSISSPGPRLKGTKHPLSYLELYIRGSKCLPDPWPWIFTRGMVGRLEKRDATSKCEMLLRSFMVLRLQNTQFQRPLFPIISHSPTASSRASTPVASSTLGLQSKHFELYSRFAITRVIVLESSYLFLTEGMYTSGYITVNVTKRLKNWKNCILIQIKSDLLELFYLAFYNARYRWILWDLYFYFISWMTVIIE